MPVSASSNLTFTVHNDGVSTVIRQVDVVIGFPPMVKATHWVDASVLEVVIRAYDTVIDGCWSMDVPRRRATTNINAVSEMRAGLRRLERSAGIHRGDPAPEREVVGRPQCCRL